MVNFELVSLALFAAIIGFLVFKDRSNIEFKYGFIIKRWTGGLDIIDRFVARYPRFITILGNIGVGIGILAGLLGVIGLIILTVNLQQAFQLVLPTAGGYQIPGPVVSVPFWYWIIAIFIIASTHETMHAVFVRLEKVKVKNYGVLLLLILPIGAFVDPDDKRIKKLAILKKLRIFAAGSLANFLSAIVAIVILVSSLFLFNSATESVGVAIDSVDPNSPAEKVGLEGTIMKINGVDVIDTLDFVNALNGTKTGDRIAITTDKGSYQIVLEDHPEIENRTYMGIGVRNSYEYNILGLAGLVSGAFFKVFITVISFLNWLIVISIGVGIVNLLPMKPLDGGLFFEEILTSKFGETGRKVIVATSFIILGLLLFNLFGVPMIKSFI